MSERAHMADTGGDNGSDEDGDEHAAEVETAGEHGDDHPSEYATERSTAPQSPYTRQDVIRGVVIAVAGLVIAFGVPLALV